MQVAGKPSREARAAAAAWADTALGPGFNPYPVPLDEHFVDVVRAASSRCSAPYSWCPV